MPAPPLFAALLLLAPAAGPADGPPAEPTAAPLPTAAELAGPLRAAVAATRRVHAAVAHRTRGTGNPAWAGRFSDLFVDGDRMQLRADGTAVPPTGWKVGRPAAAPLTGAAAARFLGQDIYGLRPPGEGPALSVLRPYVPPGTETVTSIYDAGNAYGRAVRSGGPPGDGSGRFADLPPVPLLFADRVWGDSDGEGVTALMGSVVDRFAAADPAGWVVEGRTELGGRPAVTVSAPAGGSGAARLRAWFSDDARRDLLRVTGPVGFLVEDLYDHRPVVGGAGGGRVPFAGVRRVMAETTAEFAPRPPSPAAASGGGNTEGEPERETGAEPAAGPAEGRRSEWQLLVLEPLSADIGPAAFWIDPPVDALVREEGGDGTYSERLVGAGPLESWVILRLGRRAWRWLFWGPLGMTAAVLAVWVWWRWGRLRRPGRFR